MTTTMRRLCLALALLLTGAQPALAKAQRDFGYAAEQLWPTLLRFLRVDERVKILEKDADAGYVLFELIEAKKTFSGAVELVKVTDPAGHVATRVIIKITDRPAYMEEALLNRLGAKLHDEQPPAAPSAPAPAPTPPEN